MQGNFDGDHTLKTDSKRLEKQGVGSRQWAVGKRL